MLDVVGYAASTAHRGVRLIRVPTTVLAQDDSAVGVKNGVNAFGKKNYLGTFAPPSAVINDFGFLTTLIDRDWRGGISEAVKAGLIRDAAFFDYIEAHAAELKARDLAVMEHVWDELAPNLSRQPFTGSDKYEFAAKVAMWQGAPPRRVAELFLRAAWCCVDEGDIEAERYFRRYAAWGFEDALSAQDVARAERPVLTYLTGELWRRIGDVEHARVWFERVSSEIASAKTQQTQKWIVDAARCQRDTPREWFWHGEARSVA